MGTNTGTLRGIGDRSLVLEGEFEKTGTELPPVIRTVRKCRHPKPGQSPPLPPVDLTRSPPRRRCPHRLSPLGRPAQLRGSPDERDASHSCLLLPAGSPPNAGSQLQADPPRSPPSRHQAPRPHLMAGQALNRRAPPSPVLRSRLLFSVVSLPPGV
ncbi:hypothetical protein NDU88_002739 [Pleurodeles waltl]|uniref:Uncharacterized protein n=1 Tax=Pleurodeles waltl TaxID=8319 RepID=A0AAV7PCJ3_PLEWA|nr:hypothetical protein NDU88_002739 [Pleurodeles waltl]